MKLIRMTVVSAAVIFTVGSQNLLAEDTISVSELKKEIAALKTSLQNLNSVLEQDLSQSTPPKAIMAFYLKECPVGWLPADGQNKTPDLRGEFIRGLDGGRGVDKFYELDKNTLVATPKERPLGSWQAPTLITTDIGGNALHQVSIKGTGNSEGNAATFDEFYSALQADLIRNEWYSSTFTRLVYSTDVYIKSNDPKELNTRNQSKKGEGIPMTNSEGDTSAFIRFAGTRPRNVALLYCMKE